MSETEKHLEAHKTVRCERAGDQPSNRSGIFGVQHQMQVFERMRMVLYSVMVSCFEGRLFSFSLDCSITCFPTLPFWRLVAARALYTRSSWLVSPVVLGLGSARWRVQVAGSVRLSNGKGGMHKLDGTTACPRHLGQGSMRRILKPTLHRCPSSRRGASHEVRSGLSQSFV